MKSRMISLILFMSAMVWAQTDSQKPTPQTSTEVSPKIACCCDKAAAKDAESCCAHHSMSADGKGAMQCCEKDSASCYNGKDASSCKRADKDKTASCSDCSKNHGKYCCNSKNDDKTSARCCNEHCAAHVSTGAGS